MPTPDGGRAALFVGGTRAERLARLDAVDLELRAVVGGPLVVRVPALEVDASDLVTRVHDAVEDALTAVHAPGGLYDDRGGGLLRHLGGWIFRARTVGHAGLVVVVDELHRQLDRRGGALPAAVVEEFAALLAACASRAVSLAASTAASSASGSPAVPAGIAEAFGQHEHLAAPQTVLRDPSTLVTALAGRSFSPLGVQRAIAGWLDLPAHPSERTDDDLVVLFSSPLAAPLVPEPLTTMEWPRDVALEQAPPPAAPSRVPVDGHELDGWRSVVGAAIRAAVVIPQARALRRAPSTDRDDFVARFRAGPLQLPLLRSVFGRGAEGLGDPSARLAVPSRAALADVRAAWSAVRGDADRADPWVERLRRSAEERGVRSTAWWIVPGLRCDLAPRFERRVLAPLGFARVDGGVQRSFEGEGEGEGRFAVGGAEALRFGWYSAALAAGAPLDEAADEAERAAAEGVRSLAGAFAGPTLVLVTAGAGAAEPADPAAPRIFEEGCPFAELAPWGLFTFGVNAP